jgi:hypothetical protein
VKKEKELYTRRTWHRGKCCVCARLKTELRISQIQSATLGYHNPCLSVTGYHLSLHPDWIETFERGYVRFWTYSYVLQRGSKMYAPVNYPILLPGPVTTPPPTRIGMASEAPNLPAQRSARYKDVLVPRRLSHDPLIPLSFNSTKKWL